VRSFAHSQGCSCLVDFHVFVELHEGCFPRLGFTQDGVPMVRGGLGVGVQILVGDGSNDPQPPGL
jgi:hypothetical protein